MQNWVTRKRAGRRRRREIERAIRGEFELDRPRGLARIGALMREMGELEQARMAAHARALERPRAGRPPVPHRVATRR